MAGGLSLVLSGGGAKGAFQVGVIDELVTVRGVRVDCVVGVSTGALQALGTAQDDVPAMVEQWLAIRSEKDIYTKRAFGIIGGIFGRDALYGTKPLKRLIEDFADEEKLRATGITMLIGVVNLGTGQFVSVDQTVPGIHNWVYASSAMPVFFDPLVTQDAGGIKEQWVDGGVRNVTPLDAAMEQRPRGIIVVRASPPPGIGEKRTYPNLIKIGLRAVDILQSEVSANDLKNAGLINDLIAARKLQADALTAQGVDAPQAKAILKPLDDQIAKYKFVPVHVIEPEFEISDTLEFDPAKIHAGIEAGRQAVRDQWPKIEPLVG